MPFRRVTAYGGDFGYIESVDDSESMTVVELDGKRYLVPNYNFVLADSVLENPETAEPVYRVVRDFPGEHRAVATDVKDPSVIARLVEKWKAEAE